MSIPIHYMTIRVFAKEGEDAEELRKGIEDFLPEDYEDKKVELVQEDTLIDEGNNMSTFTATLNKSRHVRDAVKHLKELLGEKQLQTILEQENRVDEKGALFIRIDKRRFAEERIAELVDHGECYHFKIMLAAHPKTRENSLEIVKQVFSPEKQV
ncbi:MAG: RNA-binding domain-containing protein [Nanobdellota archaeon]